MKLFLKKLILSNWKGAENLTVNFSQTTNIYGENGTYKTTIFDAYLWLLKDKNSLGVTKFDIKNTVKPELNNKDHFVEGVFDFDGKELSLKKVYRENWVTRRGSAELILDGHSNIYFWNGVEIPLSEYQKNIDSILDNEKFLLVSDPLYFSSEITGKWTMKERRKSLFDLVGKKTFADIAGDSSEFKELVTIIQSKIIVAGDDAENKALIQYRGELKSKISKLTDQLKESHIRLDEAKGEIPMEPDYSALNLELSRLNLELQKIDVEISDVSKANEAENNRKMQYQKDISTVELRLQELELSAKKEANEKNSAGTVNIGPIQTQLMGEESNLSSFQSRKSNIEAEIVSIEATNKDLRNKWEVENSRSFDLTSVSTCCPTCKRELDIDTIDVKREEMIVNFNAEKQKALNNIKGQGIKNNETIETLKKSLETISSNISNQLTIIEEIKQKIVSVTSNKIEPISFEVILETNSEYNALKIEIHRLKTMLQNEKFNTASVENLIEKKNQITPQVDVVKKQLGVKELVEKANDRVKKHETDIKAAAQEKANLERLQDVISRFITKWVNDVEEPLNNLFPKVRFRMFVKNLEGNMEERCDTMYEGKPWNALNHGHQVRAGIEIINVFAKSYNMFAPIFVDNSESVTSFPETECQIIHLRVAKDKQLTIE